MGAKAKELLQSGHNFPTITFGWGLPMAPWPCLTTATPCSCSLAT